MKHYYLLESEGNTKIVALLGRNDEMLLYGYREITESEFKKLTGQSEEEEESIN